MRTTFASFAHRNFRLFFAGQLVSQVGNWLTLIAQTLLVFQLTDSGLAVGVLAACQFVPILVFGAWTGLIADRSDKRRLLIIVQAVAMGQSFVLAGLAFMGEPPVLAIYAVAAVGGLCMAFDNPARRAFVVEMVPTEAVPNAVGLNSALMTTSRIIGPALAGLLSTTVGFGWAFALDGLSYLAVIAALAAIDPARLHRSPVTPRAKGQVREGLRYVRTVPDLFIPLVMMGVVGTLAFNFQVVLPVFVARDLGGDGASFTALFSVMAVGSLVGALVGARRTSVTVAQVTAATAAFGVSLLVMALVPTLVVAFPVGLLVGFTSISFMTTCTAIVQLRADPTMRGRVLALQAILFLGSTPIGGPLLGAVSDWAGARAGLVLGGVAALAVAAWAVGAARSAGSLSPAADGDVRRQGTPVAA
jgi:MFS family permease